MSDVSTHLLSSAKKRTDMLSMLLCTKPHMRTTAARTSSDGSSRSPRKRSEGVIFGGGGGYLLRGRRVVAFEVRSSIMDHFNSSDLRSTT